RRHTIEHICAKRLDRGEDVAPAVRALAVGIELTKRCIAKDGAEHIARLLKDFAAMRDEEQREWTLFSEAAIVERGDDGLARAGRGDDEVPPAIVRVAFDFELIEHRLLVRARLDLESGEGEGRRRAVVRAAHGVVE